MKKVKIFGERNTGTNYLSKLLQINFLANELEGTVPKKLDRFLRRSSNSENFRDYYFKINQKNLGWKHREIDPIFLNKIKRSNSNVIFFTLSKNPYSWFLSMYKRPYHNFKSSKLPFNEFLLQRWPALGRESNCEEYYNIIDLWNKKNASYFQLAKREKTIVTRYEDLLIDPIMELEKISKSSNLKASKNFPSNFEKSTKDQDKNSNFYLEYYGKEKWREHIDSSNVELINRHLDKNLMEKLKYEIL